MTDVPFEKIEILLASSSLQERGELHRELLLQGLVLDDDLYALRREGEVEEWQDEDALVVEVCLRGETSEADLGEIEAGAAGAWDALKVEYLLATTPRECIGRVSGLVVWACARFGLLAKLGEEVVQPDKVGPMLVAMADKLADILDEPGTEGISALVELKYA